MAPQTLSKSRAALALGLSTLPLAARAATRSDYISNALNATDVLNQNWYDSTNGLWQDLWWNSANALTALADLAAIDSDFIPTASNYFQRTYNAAPASNGGTLLNDYYDDEAWWALGWIAAFDITQDINYLSTARSIFQDLTIGLDASCGGQCWSKDCDYIGSINNELFLAVVASLAHRSPNDGTDYRTYAINQADWLIHHSGLQNSHNLILTKPGYPGPPDATAAQCKGVFVRNLTKLQSVRPDGDYVTFLQRNADSVRDKDREGDGEIGPDWQGPLFDANMTSQSSVINCLVAAAAVS
ncbi:hypothetical protein B0A48_14973 [Cryoendolithus antarcticus]|uniref:Mannan endo-1,6-alpha-mannosidase n=1 Tax=Cryoendolithus antarcticus TaxID=1507870 RepID=A0A1V8SJ00_9PEZI|nr:hypothetical protein B0A48_14973 [Cryoendolithus antarcticus]